MDFASALKPDAYRILATNAVPGFVGTAPWVSGVFWPSLQEPRTWSNAGAVLPIAITLLAVVMATGFIFEDIGSRIEIHWADHWLARKCPRLSRGWRVYLAQRRDNDLIAQGYLRAILLRVKFELSMIPAMFSCALGLAGAELAGHGFARALTLFLVVASIVLALMLLDEVRGGAAVLARTRHVIVRASRSR